MAVKIWAGVSGDYQDANNWSPPGVPAAADDVYIKESSQDIDTNLSNLGVTLSSFHVEQSYLGLLGLEDTFLEIRTALLYIGADPTGSELNGPLRCNIDVNGTACDIRVFDSNPGSADSGRNAIRLRALNAASRLFMEGGIASFSEDPEDAGQLALVDTANSQLLIGENVTLADIISRSGSFSVIRSSPTGTVTAFGGELDTDLAVALNTVEVKGGTVNHNGSGNITLANVINGLLNLLDSNVPRTITALNYGIDGEFTLDPNTVTITTLALINTVPIRVGSSDAT